MTWKDEMREVFEKALEKAERRLKEKGYVEKPWRDWDGDLRDRLREEIGEWEKAVLTSLVKKSCLPYGEQSELEDIINCAAFQHLRLSIKER